MNYTELELIGELKSMFSDSNAETIIPYLADNVVLLSENAKTEILGRDGYNGVAMYLRKRVNQICLSKKCKDHMVESMVLISRSAEKKPYLILSQVIGSKSTVMKVTIEIENDLITEINMRFQEDFLD